MDFIIDRIIEMALGSVGAAAIAGVTILARYLAGKIKNDKLRSYIDEVALLAKNNVLAVMQSVVEPAKAAASDGKLTQEEGRKVKAAVMAGIKRQMPNDALRIFTKMNVNYEDMMNAMVEREVLESKWAAKIKEIGK